MHNEQTTKLKIENLKMERNIKHLEKGWGVRVAKLEYEIQRMMDMQLEYRQNDLNFKDKGMLGMSDCLMEEIILREELKNLLDSQLNS